MDSREIRRIIWQGVDIKKASNNNIELWNCRQGGCNTCQSACQTSCESSCQNSCERSCQTGCQTSCQSACEKACQSGAQRPCRTDQSPRPCGQTCGRIQGGGGQY